MGIIISSNLASKLLWCWQRQPQSPTWIRVDSKARGCTVGWQWQQSVVSLPGQCGWKAALKLEHMLGPNWFLPVFPPATVFCFCRWCDFDFLPRYLEVSVQSPFSAALPDELCAIFQRFLKSKNIYFKVWFLSGKWLSKNNSILIAEWFPSVFLKHFIILTNASVYATSPCRPYKTMGEWPAVFSA